MVFSSFGFENSIDWNVIQGFSGWKVGAQIGGNGVSTLIRSISDPGFLNQ